tara:strand:+ start:943 stop:2232 length:1290 start_codon:yes stop_codon:yes gene_type:complete
MILKRPSFRRGGNSGIAMLRQRYARGANQNFLNPGAPKTIQDFYKDRAARMQETGEGIAEFIKAKPRGPGTFRGYKVPEKPPVIAEAVIDDQETEVGNYPQEFPTTEEIAAVTTAPKTEAKVESPESSITLDPKEEIAKEAEFIKDLLKNENLTRGENALILAKAIGTPGSISDKISKAADLALPVVRKRDKQDKAVTLKAYELFKKKEAEQAKRDAPTSTQKDIESVAEALIRQGDKRSKADIVADIRIKAAGFDKEGKALLSKGGGEVFEIAEDIRKQRDKLTIAQGKKKPNQKDIEKINKKISELQARLRTIASVPGFDEIFVGIREEYLAKGGRIGYAEGTPEEEVKITETVVDTPGAPTPERQVLKLSYSELRNKLPKEISDDIVELLANSTEALQDFAYITTQDDVSNFNVKYGVNLVIPQTA